MRITLFIYLVIVINLNNVIGQEYSLRDLSLLNIKTENLLQECGLQITAMKDGVLNKTMWALMMLDAGSRMIPEGLLNGNLFDLGNYDECINIEAIVNSVGTINGKYCLSMIKTSLMPMNGLEDLTLSDNITVIQRKQFEKFGEFSDFVPLMIGLDETTKGIHLGFCVPDACTANDLNNGLSDIFRSDLCYTKNTNSEVSVGAIVTIVILGLIALTAFVSTTYDIFIYSTEKKPLHPLCIAFSVLSNGRKLLKTTNSQEHLTCLNGLRAISMMWVILGHEYLLAGPYHNYKDLGEVLQFTLGLGILQTPVWRILSENNYKPYKIHWIDNPSNMFIMGATVSVDTFFAIGGLVTVYAFLTSCDKGVNFNLPLYYVHRYLRLTPPLAIIILIYATLLNYLGDGPMWAVVENELSQGCRDTWWKTLLYIQNYFVDDGICVGQGWYLAVDMQLFILSPLVLLPLKRWPKYTIAGLIILAIGGVVSPFLITWHYNIPASLMNGGLDTMSYYYMVTYARFGPYVLGMIAGFIIYKTKRSNFKLEVPKTWVVIFWILLLTGLTSCVYAGYDLNTNKDQLPNSLFLALGRNAWALGICLLVVACTLGYGGPIDAFLSIPVFQIIARLSYSMYLTHYAILQIATAAARVPIHFSNFNLIFLYWGHLFKTMAYSVVLCLLLESPMINIERQLLGSSNRRGVRKPEKTESEAA